MLRLTKLCVAVVVMTYISNLCFCLRGSHEVRSDVAKRTGSDDMLWTEILTHDAQLNEMAARCDWLAHDVDVMNTSMRSMVEALRRFDLSLNPIIAIQRRQDSEIYELQRRRPVTSFSHENTAKSRPSLVKTGSSWPSSDMQHDAPVTSQCCEERELEGRLGKMLTAKLKSPLVFMRVLGDGMTSLNSTVTSLAAQCDEQVEYLNLLAVELERMKDLFYRNRRRVRALTSRAQSLEEKLDLVLSLEERVSRLERLTTNN